MYTPFAGSALITDYVRQRAAFKARLVEIVAGEAVPSESRGWPAAGMVLTAAHSASASLAWLRERPLSILPAPPGEKEFCIEPLLFDLLSIAMVAPNQHSSIASDWLGLLLKRFEITKRLHDRYDSRGRKLGSECATLDPYAALAVLLAWDARPEAPDGIRRLNTVLKLTDLIASAPGEKLSSSTARIAIAAVEKERALMQQLLNQHGLTVEPHD